MLRITFKKLRYVNVPNVLHSWYCNVESLINVYSDVFISEKLDSKELDKLVLTTIYDEKKFIN